MRLPIGEVTKKMGNSKVIICCCYEEEAPETQEHLFLRYSKSATLWQYFANVAGVNVPFLQLKCSLYKWWNEECSTKLKQLYQAMPSFPLWQIQKARNIIRHGGKQSY